jgi:hypothetical protein
MVLDQAFLRGRLITQVAFVAPATEIGLKDLLQPQLIEGEMITHAHKQTRFIHLPFIE